MIRKFCDRCGGEEIRATEYQKGPAFAVHRYVVTVQPREHLGPVATRKDLCEECSKRVTEEINAVLSRKPGMYQ